jgi:DNA repair exonuclease SbcCD ATPase subunit
MTFFTLGNLITLAIVALLLFLFRQLDKGKRPLEMLRKYSEKLKEELAKYAGEKEEAVKSYGVSLDVEQQAARKLMERLQLGGQEIAAKVAAMTKIDERINSYDAALEELVGMTARVEENLGRLRDESVFVEDAFAQAKGLREKLGALEKDLGSLEQRFLRENGEALEKTQEAVLGSLRSAIEDLEVQAQSIESKVEDHREFIDKVEKERAGKLEKEGEYIKSLLARSVEEAGRRADKLEDAALVKLREQAQDRVEKLKGALEEKIKTYQETAKARVGEIQELLKQQRGEARAIVVEFAQNVKEQRQEWQTGEAAFAAQNEQINAALALQEQKWLDASAAMDSSLALQERKWQDVSAGMDAVAVRQAEYWKNLASGLENTLETQRDEWRDAAGGLNNALKVQQEQVEHSLSAQQQHIENSLNTQKQQIESALGAQKQRLESGLAAHTDQLETSLAALKDRTETLLAAQQDQVDSSLADHRERIKTEFAAGQDQMESGLAALKDRLESDFAGHQEQMEARVTAFTKRAETELSAHGGYLESALAELKERAEAELSSRRDQLESGIAGLKTLMETELAAYNSRAETALAAQQQEWASMAAESQDILRNQYDQWRSSMEDASRRALEESESQLETYKAAQAEEFTRLALIADDASRLETELRRIMEEAETRVRSNFAQFEEEATGLQQSAASAFDVQVKTFDASLDKLREELTGLTETAHGALLEKLNAFEDEFFSDLSQRKTDIDRRFIAWQETVDQRLAVLGEEALEGRQEMEAALAEESRRNLAAQGEKLASGLERLRQETAALEAGIREEMLAADEARGSFRSQLGQDMEELRLSAESSIKVEIGRYTLSAQETIKLSQRDLEARLKEITDALETRNGELRAAQERVRELAEENDSRLTQFRSNLDKAREEATAQRQEILERTQEEARSINAAVEEAERRIKDFTAQTRLFDRADELKTDLERGIEDLRGDIDRLDQRKSEVAQMEGEFARIRRLGDEVGAKMNRFLLEQRRIDVMEGDFHRLIQVSQAVEERLAQVQDTGDTLEAMQVQFRRLEDAVKEAEEKYQRIERKNETLEETNNGIARNFKALQDSETFLAHLKSDQDSLSARLEKMGDDIEAMAAENEKAQTVADKLGILDGSLAAIEQRIKDMQKAREWLAGLETRMDELYRQAQDHVKLAGTIINREPPPQNSSITPALRENVLRLARQRWSKEQISNSLKISQGEVELILEFASRDNI